MTIPAPPPHDQDRKARAEAMAVRFMPEAFAVFDSEYGRGAAKSQKLVMEQADAKVVQRWRNAIRMALLCIDATDQAMDDYEESFAQGGSEPPSAA